MKWRKEIFLAVALTILLCLPEPIRAQCSMCRAALVSSPEGKQMMIGFNQGILLLLTAPFLVVGAVAFLILRAHRTGKLQGMTSHAGNPKEAGARMTP